MARPYVLSTRQRGAAVILYRHGWRPDEIAEYFDTSPATIRRIIKDAYREADKVRRAQELVPESAR